MNLKRALIETLPPGVKRLIAVPYDRYQTHKADRRFARKSLPNHDPHPDAPDHIVCIVVDALRADAVDNETTPFLASLSGTDAVTPGTWTFPAVSSMLSGVHPHEHGAMRQTDDGSEPNRLTLPPKMDPDRLTLTEWLAGAGYDTFGGFGHDTPFVALAGRFEHHALFHKVNSRAEDVLEAYIDWRAGRDRTFAFLHLADPHVPVDPPAAYWEAHDVDRSIDGLGTWRYRTEIECDEACSRYRDHRRRLYHAAIDYVDDTLERFARRLESEGLDPLLVVTSDHGEAMWEQVQLDVERFDGSGCVGHGGTPYEALARVPLLTNTDWPREGPASLVDLAPSLADVVGLPANAMSGYSLVDGPPSDRVRLVEGTLRAPEKKAVYRGRYKLIVSAADGVEMGFELPDEELTTVPEPERRELLAALPPWPDGSRTAGTHVSSVVKNRLERLGYR